MLIARPGHVHGALLLLLGTPINFLSMLIATPINFLAMLIASIAYGLRLMTT